jgi:transcriptional regulator with XRE-family HTH domain
VDIYKAEFGQKLRAARKAAGLTQEKLAELVGVEGPSVSRWEKGHDFPDDSRLPQICDALKITEDYFRGDTRLSKPSPQQMKHLIEAPAESLLQSPLALVLERFAKLGPEVRASVLAILYNDGSISEPYLRPGSTPAKRTKAR